MKIALIYNRLNMSKWFSPIIGLALESQIDIECFLDHRDVSNSTKWYEFPDIKKLPDFQSEKLVFKPYKDIQELELLIQDSSANFLISLSPLPFKKKPGMKWVHIVPSLHDSFIAFSPEQISTFDIIFCNTDFWAEKCIKYLELNHGLDPSSFLAIEIKSKFIPIGSPQYDHFKLCNNATFKEKMRWPKDRKIVTVYAFETSISFWAQRIFHNSSTLLRILFFLLGPLAYPRIFTKLGIKKFSRIILAWLKRLPIHLSQVFLCPSEEQTLRAISEFCKRNDCYFVIKSRKKNPLRSVHKKYADFIIEEDTDYYPYTSAQVISASDLLISFYSTSAVESAVLRVPFINLRPVNQDLYLGDHYTLQFDKRSDNVEKAELATLYLTGKKTLFDYPGVIWNYELKEFVNKFHELSLNEFSINEGARSEYIEKYVDPNLSKSPSKRILQILQAYLEDDNKEF